jgi:dolichyl-phosphate-mannose-protein mannosyltransferase
LNANKYDWLTIIILCILFFSIASYNLGSSIIPSTSTELQSGQSFYVDLGTQTNMTSIWFFTKSAGLNVSISIGNPSLSLSQWTIAVTNLTYPDTSKLMPEYADIYKDFYFHSYANFQFQPYLNQTQYLKFDINQPPIAPTVLEEIAILDQNYQRSSIQSITNLGPGNPNLHNLIDEQSIIQVPPTYMVTTTFDENFYARTAEQILNHQMPTEPSNPELGKIIIAAGLSIFGVNPFGWRIMSVVFATLMIPLMYFLGKKLLGTWIGGFSAAFLFTFDFMHFTLARLGILDTFLEFFILASQLFFLIYVKEVLSKGWKTSVLPLFLSTILFALAFSTKWTAILGFGAEIAILAALRFKDVLSLKGKSLQLKASAFFAKPFAFYIIFIFLAIAVYFATFTPLLAGGGSVGTIFQTQLNMLHFQQVFTVSGGGASPWYSWPFMYSPSTTVPMLLTLTWGLANGAESVIILLGNPAVWWVGFAAVFLLLGYFFKVYKGHNRQEKKNLFPALFILAFFFIQWLPYFFISRITFIYYFYANVPFMALASAFFINKIWKDNWGKIMVGIYFMVFFVMFVMFYPIISGAPASPNTINSLNIFGN